MQLPKLTPKQLEILVHLFTYRYMDREQIQSIMNHKDRKTINVWLRDLRAKDYVCWIYSEDFAEKIKPAIYYLGPNGIRLLKTLRMEDDNPRFPLSELRKRYKDNDRSESFISRSMVIAQCGIDFQARSSDSLRCACVTQSYFGRTDHPLSFLLESSLSSQLGPQLFVQNRTKDKNIVTNYFIEVFDLNLPRYRMSKRLKQYITFLTEGEWEANDYEPDSLPQVLLICPRQTDLIYLKRKAKGLIKELWEDDQEKVNISFTTLQVLAKSKATSPIWERV
jgi:hypothetical protein